MKKQYDVNKSQLYFLDLSPKAKEIKAKLNKWDLIKLKSFCTAKETIWQNEKTTYEWEKIFVNDMTDKELIFKIYKQLIKLNIKKNWKVVRRHEYTFFFSKEDTQKATGTGKNTEHC